MVRTIEPDGCCKLKIWQSHVIVRPHNDLESQNPFVLYKASVGRLGVRARTLWAVCTDLSPGLCLLHAGFAFDHLIENTATP